MTEITRNQQNSPSRWPEAVAIVASLILHAAIAVTLRWNLTQAPTRPSSGTVKVVELTSNELNRLPPSVQRAENNPPPIQPEIAAIQPPATLPLPTPLVPNTPPPNAIPNAPSIVSQPTPTPSPSPSPSRSTTPTPSPSPSRQPIPDTPSVRTPPSNTPIVRRDSSPRSTPSNTPRDYRAPRSASTSPSLPSPSPSPSITTSPSPTPRTSIFIPPPGPVVPPSGFNPPGGGGGNGSGNNPPGSGNSPTTPPIVLPTTPPSDNPPGNPGNGGDRRQPNIVDGGETLNSLYQNALRQETSLRQRYPGLISRQPRDLSIPYPPGVPCQPNTLHAIVYMVVIDENLDPDTTAIVGTQSIRGRTNLSQQAVSKATDVLSELLANNDANPSDRIRNPADGNNPVLVSFRVKYKCNN